MEIDQDYEFSPGDMNSFFYTNDKQLVRMDDKFILAKVTEKYPDFAQTTNENLLKQVIIVIVSDSKLIEELEKKYDIEPSELLKTIYRNYEYVFNKCFVTKIQKTIKHKRYARREASKRRGKMHT